MSKNVETTYGKLAGEEVAGVHVFRGVPFARPPVGSLRFAAPEPPARWRGVREALRSGAAPLQVGAAWMTRMRLDVGGRVDEDCLYLNVYTPASGGARRPVLVFLHGGAFLMGAGSTALYDSRRLARRSDIVVVTCNYRLGALGWAHLGLVPGSSLPDAVNLGLKDQIAALGWVRDNIAAFGGDPENVTLCGQSAGAMSAAALCTSPSARALFRRAIVQSAAGNSVIGREEGMNVARLFLAELGLKPETAHELREVSAARLLKAQASAWRRTYNPLRLMSFMPVVDGALVPETPLAAIARGVLADKELLIGTTREEWKLFSLVDGGLVGMRETSLVSRIAALSDPRELALPDAELASRTYRDAVAADGGSTDAADVWNAFQSARVFHHPAARLAEAQVRAGGRAFSYLFAWRPPAVGGIIGACHALELPFVFGWTQIPLVRSLTGLSTSARRLSLTMQHAWGSFARSGNPSHEGLPSWPGYEPILRSTMLLSRDARVIDAPLEAERRLFDSWTVGPGAA
jgi:para-nitrobenzyl esterase